MRSPIFLLLFITFAFFGGVTPPFVYAADLLIDVLSSDPQFNHFLRALQRQRLVRELNHYPSATIFAPVNEAIENWEELSQETLLYHILFDEVKLEGLLKGQLLGTRLVKQGRLGEGDGIGQMVKVDRVKGEDRIYVGNARITDTDDFKAENGIIYPAHAVLKTPVDLFDTLKSLRLRIFTEYIVANGLEKFLREINHTTIFAPTDDAITSKLVRHERKYLVSKCGSSPQDLDMVLKHHMHDHVVYSDSDKMAGPEVPTLQGEPIEVKRYSNGTIRVGSGSVTFRDSLAENGVVHVIDNISLPLALSFNELKYICGLDATKFVQWIINAGLKKRIENSEISYTILAPRDGGTGMHSLESNDEKLDFLNYHFIKEKFDIEDLSNGKLLDTTLNISSLNWNPQRVKVSVVGDKNLKKTKFNDVTVIGEPVSIGKSIIYVLSRPLAQPVGVSRTLSRDPRFSSFAKAVSTNDPKGIFRTRKGITVFSPTNKAFEKLGLVYRYFLHPMGQEDFYSVLKYHVLNELLYIEDIKPGESQYKTIEGTTISLERRRDDDVILFKGQNLTSKLVEFDILVENGVVHALDSVQLPPAVEITPMKILTGMNASTMLQIFNITNFTSILTERTDPFTILLPPEKDLQKLNITKLANDRDKLARLLGSHIIQGVISEFKDGKGFPTLSSKSPKIVIKWDVVFQKYYFEFDNEVRVNILAAGNTSSGGVVYQVDKVLQRNPVQHFLRAGLGVLFGLGLGGFLTMGGGIGWYGVQKFRRWGYEPVRDSDLIQDESDVERGTAGVNQGASGEREQAASESPPEQLTNRENEERPVEEPTVET